MIYVCAQLASDGSCAQFTEFSTLFYLPDGQGLKIGGMFLMLSFIAWGVGLTVSQLLKR